MGLRCGEGEDLAEERRGARLRVLSGVGADGRVKFHAGAVPGTRHHGPGAVMRGHSSRNLWTAAVTAALSCRWFDLRSQPVRHFPCRVQARHTASLPALGTRLMSSLPAPPIMAVSAGDPESRHRFCSTASGWPLSAGLEGGLAVPVAPVSAGLFPLSAPCPLAAPWPLLFPLPLPALALVPGAAARHGVGGHVPRGV